MARMPRSRRRLSATGRQRGSRRGKPTRNKLTRAVATPGSSAPAPARSPPRAEARTRRILVARQNGRIVGTVQLDLDTPPNQPHRAEVTKLLVHPEARRQGIARQLMVALEEAARSARRTLLTLDTWTGSHAEQLYRSLGYTVVGVIPRYARGSITKELDGTTIMYKELA